MMKIYLQIVNVAFELLFDYNIAESFLNRVKRGEKSTEKIDVKIVCRKRDKLIFTCPKFLKQQEPDVSESYIFREIFELGVFKYSRKEKILEAYYIDDNQYPYNNSEVVVDTLLQFIYLIMLDYNVIPLHAATVAYKNNGVLLFGNSGAGKTTLELSLLGKGFQFFSDDVVFIDINNFAFNSNEYIMACSKKTIEIANRHIKLDDFKNFTFDDMTHKRIFQVPYKFICKSNKIKPVIIIFLEITDGEEKIERVSGKKVYLELIRLSVSEQFDVKEKIMYMRRLKTLVENTIAFQYYRNNNSGNTIKRLCKQIEKECDGVN